MSFLLFAVGSVFIVLYILAFMVMRKRYRGILIAGCVSIGLGILFLAFLFAAGCLGMGPMAA